MTNYLKTGEVLTRLNIEIFELFDLCKNGKLQAYNEYGKRFVDPDLCEKGKKYTLDEILRLVHLEEGTKETGRVYYPGYHRGNIEKPLTREEQERKARKQYNDQPDVPIVPEDCVLFNFSFPASPSEFQTLRDVQKKSKQKIKDAETFRFKKSDVEKLEIECGIEHKPLPKSKQSVDEYVRNLTIYPENDDTINIKVPGKSAVTISGNSLGFYRMPGKEWDLLQDILKDGQIYISSDKERKRLKVVEEKLIKILNDNFNAQTPHDYKLFEKSHKHKKGTRKPKFKTQLPPKFSNLTKEQIFGKLTKEQTLKEEFIKDNPNKEEYERDEIIHDLVVAAKEKGASNTEIENIILRNQKNIEEYKNNEIRDFIEKGGHITNKP